MRDKSIKILEDATRILTEPMTLRQLFYQMVSVSSYPKTEEFYHSLSRVIGMARDHDQLSWDLILDSSRLIEYPTIFDDVADWKRACLSSLKFPIWRDAPVVFIEKRALLGVITPVLKKYRIIGVAIGGYCSKTILNDYRDKEIIYLGDWDADGQCISDAALKYCLNLERIALNEDQVKRYNLPTRPQKKTSTRAKNWGDDAVELDALPKSILLKILEYELEARVDPEYRDEVITTENNLKAGVVL